MRKKPQPVSPLDPFLILKYFLAVWWLATKVASPKTLLILLGLVSAIMTVVIACDSV